MSNQLGFDFGDSAPQLVAQTVGTWSDPEFTTSQYNAMFTKAQDRLQSIAGPARRLFAQGLENARVEHAKMTAHHGNDDQPYRLWRTRCHVTDQEFSCFVDHCRLMIGIDLPGMEFKVRNRLAGLTAAMHVSGLGTLIAWRWSADNYAIDFRPWRDTFFLDSYRDHIPLIEAPYSLWAIAYCADKLAESDQGVANVPTFMLNGREYINDGVSGSATHRECEGWTFCALADWNGPTYNYRSQCRAWDTGTLERGDRRGLIVHVRGQKCVLDSAATIYDTQVKDAVADDPAIQKNWHAEAAVAESLVA